MVVIVTNGNQEIDETIVLGTEQEESNIRIGLVLPLWRDTEIKLDGDGGFSVHSGDRQHVFKPLSVQSMWTALQTLYKCTEHARLNNYYVGGLSHTWMSYYSSRLTTDGSVLNEWNLSEDVESFRPDSPIYTSDISNCTEESKAFEKVLSYKLRHLMLEQDLEETTSKQLRLLLESEVGQELKEYREFLDRQMLRILGQMERPSQIYEYLYLGSEWNASNLSELKDLGVKFILNITKEIDNFYPEEFKYLNIRLYDVPGSALMKHWDKTYKFIKEAKLSGKKVLVHCKMGISRSAATVIAYTMKEYNMSLEEALEHVKGKRSVVNPNDGFMQQLKDYEGILRARHNDLWGKKAPSRLHPLQMSRKLFHSEPSLPECTLDHTMNPPELSFLPEEPVPLQHALHSSLSLFPPNSSGPVDKHENIRNYLASLPPPPITIDEDQGISGDNPGTSESGSGYSTPNLSPTDNELNLNMRYQKLMSKRARSGSVDSNQQASGEDAKEQPDGAADEVKSEGEVTFNVQTENGPKSEELVAKLSDAEIRQPVAIVNQIPFTIRTIGVESVSVPGSIEPSSLSPNPSSNVSLCSQPFIVEEEESGQPTFRLGSVEPDDGQPMEEGTVQEPQIQSVPEIVKQIEKLNSKSDSNLGSLAKESAKVNIPTIMSRNSSVHSALSSCDQELAQLATPSTPPRHTSTRHESLSPSPPSKRLTEHVRHSSLIVLPSNQPPNAELSAKCDSEDQLGPSLRGAVRARILDIEEKGGKELVSRKHSFTSEKSDVSMRSTSPSRLHSQRPASVAVDGDPNTVTDSADAVSCSPDIKAKTRLSRRESTPPAVSSAWGNFLTEDLPPPPVEDLKRRFEDSGNRRGGALRRSQSLRTVETPRRIPHRTGTSSPEQSVRSFSRGGQS